VYEYFKFRGALYNMMGFIELANEDEEMAKNLVSNNI
jgi:hypothetical protein